MGGTITNYQSLDSVLKGRDTGEADAPPVRIFVMGGGGGYRNSGGRLFHGGRWRDEESWPLARTQYTKYYLHQDGMLAPEGPDADGGDTVYRFDPANPVPSIGGNVSSLSSIGPLPPGVPDSAHAPWRARVRLAAPRASTSPALPSRILSRPTTTSRTTKALLWSISERKS